MIEMLIVTRNRNDFYELADVFSKNDLQISWAESGEEALSLIRSQNVQLVIADEHFFDMTGVELIEKLVLLNPMICCAAVSSLSEEDFHEASEGLGILMQLPVCPKKEDADKLFKYFKKISEISKPLSRK